MIGATIAVAIILGGCLLRYWKSIGGFLIWRWKLSKMRTSKEIAYPLIGHCYRFPREGVDFFDFIATKTREFCENQMDKLVTIWLGPVPVVLVSHPESAEVLLRSSKHMKKSFVYRFLLPWIGTGLLTSWGKKWQTRRRLITPTFHFNILQDFLDVMNEQSELMVDKITQQLDESDNKEVDLGKCITLCALDVICETAMGKSVNAQQYNDSEYVKAIYRLSDIIQLRQKTPTLWWDWAFDRMKLGSEHKSLLKTLHSFTQGVIKDRMANRQHTKEKKRLAFLDVLMESTDENGDSLGFSDIQEEVDTFMFEGHDTTAAAMTWAAYMLGKHPEVQQKVHDELDQVFGDDYNRPVTMEDVRKVKYLEQVIKESLRLYPSVPIMGRVTSEECVLDGYSVPKGVECLLMVYALHRNPNVWTDPDKFDPERFNKDNSANRNPYAFIPFSAGPRNCIGQKFALQEEKVLLIHLLRRFTLVSHDDEATMKKRGELILRPAQKLDITLTKRN